MLAVLVASGCGVDLAVDRIVAPIVVRSALADVVGDGAAVGLRSTRLVGLRRFDVTGLEIVLADSAGVLGAERVSVSFSLAEALGSPTRLRLVRLGGVRVELTRTEHGWPRLGATDDAPDSTGGARIVIDRLELEDAGFVALQAAGERLLSVDGAGGVLSSLAGGDEPAVEVTEAALRAESPGWTDGWIELAARGALARGVWEIGALEVTDDAGGRVTVTGSVGPGGEDGTALDLHVGGYGVRLGSVHPSTADLLGADERAAVDLRVTGSTTKPRLTGRITTDSAGALFVDGSIERAEVTSLDAVVTLEGLDVRRLIDGRGPEGRWNGTVSARLALGEPDETNGEVEVDLGLDGATGPVEVEGSADVVEGVFVVDLRSAGRGQSAVVRGEVAPLASEPTYHLTLESSVDAPIEAGTDGPIASLRGPWDLTVTLSGHGVTPGDAVADLEGSVRTGADLPTPVLGRLDGQVSEGSADLDLRFDVGAGTIEAHAVVPLEAAAEGWRVDRLELSDVPTGPWGAEGWAETVSGQGSAVAEPRGLSGTLRLDPVRGGRLDGAIGNVAVTVSPDATLVTGTFSALGATATLERLAVAGGTPQRVVLAFSGLDPSALFEGGPVASIGGHVDLRQATGGRGAPAGPGAPAGQGARGRGAAPAATPSDGRSGIGTLTGSVTLVDATLGDAALGEAPLTGGGDLTVEASAVDVDFDFESDGEALRVSGRVSRADQPVFVLRDARLDAITSRRWLGSSAPDARVTAELAGSWVGSRLELGSGDASLRLDSTVVGGFTVEGADISVRLADGSGRATGTLRSSGREARLNTEIQATERGWGAFTELSVRGGTAEAPSDSLDATVDLAPSGDAGSGYRIAVAGVGRVADLPFDTVSVDAVVADGAASFERIHAASPYALIEGSGTLPFGRASSATGSLEITARSERPGLLAPELGLLGSEASVEATLRTTGLRSDLRHDVDVVVLDVSGGAVEVDSVRLAVRARSSLERWLSAVDAEISAGGASALALRPVATGPTIALGRTDADGSITAVLGWSAEEPASVAVRSARLTVDEVEWDLEEPALVSWGDGLELHELRLGAERDRMLHLDGRLGRTGEQSLVAEVRALPIRVESDGETLLARDVSLDVRLAGNAERVVAALEGEVGGVGTTPGATLTADLDSSGIRLDIRGTQSTGGSFRGVGEVPRMLSFSAESPLLAATGDAVDFEIVVDSVDLAPLGPVLGLGPSDETRGRLDADVRLTGPERDARASGELTVSALSGRVAATGTSLRADRLLVTLDERQATLREIVIRDAGRGTARLSGSVDLTDVTDPGLAVRADFERFELLSNPTLDGTFSGGVTLDGTVRAPSVRGALSVVSGTYHIPADDAGASVEAIELTEEDYVELARRFGLEREDGVDDRPHPLDAVALDLGLSATTNFWARRTYDPAIAVELGGDLRLVKQPGGDLELYGRLEVVRGRSSVVQFGRRFQVSQGTITFDGPPAEAELEARALFAVEDAEIWIDVEREGGALSFVLGSDPPLTQSDIIAYLATGRRASDVDRFGEQGSAAADVGTDIALAPVTAGVEELARRQLGLDVVEIQQDGLNGLTLVAGRFVTPKLFVGVQQPVAFDGGEDTSYGIDRTQVNAEYRVSPWLMTHMTGALSLFRIFLAVEYAR